MAASTRIYVSGALTFGGQFPVNDLLSAGYGTIIVWSVHVAPDGSLYLNDTQIVSGGVYKEATRMDLPAKVAQLHKAGMEIIFSVGAGGTCDFSCIDLHLGGQTGAAGNVIYDNFKALKKAMTDAGGAIDAIDFDNEDKRESGVMINFANTLKAVGYNHVTFCPYTDEPIWFDTMASLVKSQGSDFVNAIHLQCYDGGDGNVDNKVLSAWVAGFKKVGGTAKMIAGLASIQNNPGPWWDGCHQGQDVTKYANFAMYGGADWSNYLYTQNFPNVQGAIWKAPSAATFFFYCRDAMTLQNGRQFKRGDAVYFCGVPSWGSAPQCDSYYLKGACLNRYNYSLGGACPSDLEAQYRKWGNKLVDGGFIWLYDSILGCSLANCCDSKVATALAYSKAITNGLS